ncbi:MAG: flippase [Lachnospiraceae bacterium]|nr:flippase [Lachnospiraceae bacterium]
MKGQQGKKSSVSFNYIMNMILTVSTILFPLISFPYVSRILNPEGIGRVSFVVSVISYFSMAAQLGIPTYGIRECAKLRDNKTKLSQFVKEIILINGVTCIFIYAVFIASVLCIPKFRTEKILFLSMGCSIIFNSMGLEWLYKGLEEYVYITKRSILFKFIAFIGMFLLIRTDSDVLQYGILTIFASVGSNICNWINAKKYVSWKGIEIISFRRHLKPVFLFFLMSIATTIYTNLDNVMLGFMSDNTEVGYYTAATKIKAALVSVVASLGTVLLPRASYYIEKNKKVEFLDISKKAMEFTMILAIPLTVYFIEFSQECILVLSGKAYAGAFDVMIAIMPTVIFIGMTNVIGMQILVPLGKEKIVFCSVLGGAVTDFVINRVAIPKYGALGAAIGTSVAEAAVLLIQWFYNRKMLYAIMKNISHWKILLATAIGAASVYGITGSSIYPIVKMILSFAVFWGIYFISLVVFRESLMTELLKKYVRLLFNKVKKNEKEL